MTFLTTLGLAVALLVVAPVLAHRLRRRRAEEQPFPPARLVLPAPSRARRRSRLEDRALLAMRAVLVAGLAVLGATPFVRCSRLALQRTGGASIAMALVVDDSMSMRADARGVTRFERALRGGREILASAREGDAVAIVLAGAPARVVLAATIDIAEARRALDSLTASDRPTDLDGAVALASSLVSALPQIDRRVVLLSDLSGATSPVPPNREPPPLASVGKVPLSAPLDEIRGALPDCAVLRAGRTGMRVRIALACGPGQSAAGREVVLEDASGRRLGREAAGGGAASELTIVLHDAADKPHVARLSPGDAIAADDAAPVAEEESRGRIAIVATGSGEEVATGGPPIVEQAFSALKLDVDTVPVPALPDRAEDFAGDLGVAVDDPPGFTPEQRRALSAFLENGGVALVALGPRSAAAPLGSTLEPVLGASVTWVDTKSAGADPASAADALATASASWRSLGASRRALLADTDRAAYEALVRWTDGLPLVARRRVGRGEVWIVTLPFSVDQSDLPVRPGFLAMLDAWASVVREHAVPQRTDVGVAWTFPGARDVRVEGPSGPVPVQRDGSVPRVTPSQLGAYRITIDGRVETRIAAPSAGELDMRPRRLDTAAAVTKGTDRAGTIDASGPVAMVLLAFMAGELALRGWSSRRRPARPVQPSGGKEGNMARS